MKNVIDMTQRLKKHKGANKTSHQAAPVIDMTEKRNEILLQERRRVRRTILSEFVGAFVVVPSKGLCQVTLFDISDNGLAFDMDMSSGHFRLGEEVAMRVYLNQNTYFPFVARIQNLRTVADEAMYRHGANFVKGTINDLALHHFIKFIETVSTSLQSDNGDLKVSNQSR